MLFKFFVFLYFLKADLSNIHFERKTLHIDKTKAKVSRVGHFPAIIKENSGLSYKKSTAELYTHGDSGTEPKVYVLNRDFSIIKEKNITSHLNIDWEEICSDPKGNLYIGDFGNNSFNRIDQKIIILKDDTTSVIKFSFTEAADCEAMIFFNDSLWLFTKSWSKGLKKSSLYKLPAKAGTYSAQKTDEITLKAQITGAAISPDNSELALISYGKVFFFDISSGHINFNKPKSCRMIRKGQTEAITYISNNKLIFTNEKGKIFSFTKL